WIYNSKRSAIRAKRRGSAWVRSSVGYSQSLTVLITTKLRQGKRIVHDGLNAKFMCCHGQLANRQPGSAFLAAGAQC
ncbi:unnamed protein product, partial [Brassica oleracea]